MPLCSALLLLLLLLSNLHLAGPVEERHVLWSTSADESSVFQGKLIDV